MLALGSWGLQTASETDTHCSFKQNGKMKRPETVETPHAHVKVDLAGPRKDPANGVTAGI
jgi:hypothetical protein